MRRITLVLVATIAVLLPAVPAAAASTLTVSATTDLVHGQDVVIRGQGWTPRHAVFVAQCPADVLAGCEELGYRQIGDNGRFNVRVDVEAVLDAEDGAVDCRTAPCELVVSSDRPPLVTRTRALSFDPSGPDPERRQVVVDPTIELVDGQQVHITGSDFEVGDAFWPGSARFSLCRDPVVAPTDCDQHSRQYADVADDGTIDGHLRVDPILHLSGGDQDDCRAGGCSILVQAERFAEEEISEAALVPVAFDPDAPLRAPPSGTVTPATDLVDDQPVRVDVTGFDPHEYLDLQQCVGPVGDASFPRRCHFDIGRSLRADAAGEVHRNLHVRTRIWDEVHWFDCRQRPCNFVLTQFGPRRRVVLRLRFDPEVDVLHPRVWLEPAEGLRPGQVVTLHGSGFRAWDYLFVRQCPPGGREYETCDHRSQMRVGLGGPQPGRPPGEEWSRPYTVRRVMVPIEGRRRSCIADPCQVVVEQRAVNPTFVVAPIHFARTTGRGRTPPHA